MRPTFAALMASTLLLTLLAACGSAPKPAMQASAPVGASATSTSAAAQASGAQLGQAQGQRSATPVGATTAASGSLGESVFFAFDDATITADKAPVIQQQALWLQGHPQAAMTLQGHTDERGGSEYNLALGQRRAEAVRKALVILGAQGERIDTVSFGKERPRATCHEETCWKEDRRVDAVDKTSAH